MRMGNKAAAMERARRLDEALSNTRGSQEEYRKAAAVEEIRRQQWESYAEYSRQKQEEHNKELDRELREMYHAEYSRTKREIEALAAAERARLDRKLKADGKHGEEMLLHVWSMIIQERSASREES